jgi:uncharacterized protein YpbB
LGGQGARLKGDTKMVSYEFFQQGLRVHEIAVRRGLKPSTIFGHLSDLYLAGKDVDVYKLAPKGEIDEVVRACKQVGVESLREIYEFFIYFAFFGLKNNKVIYLLYYVCFHRSILKN